MGNIFLLRNKTYYLLFFALLILGGALKGSYAKQGGKYCTSKTRVQVVFIQDRTFSFKPFIREFVRAVEDLTKLIQAEFPLAEFGYTAFADFAVKMKKHYPYRDKNPVNPRTSCYELIQPLTNDKAKFQNAVTTFATMSPVMGAYDPPESSLTGILYTAADLRINWSAPDPHVRRIAVLITDEDTITFRDAPYLMRKPKPRGDGFDNCVEHGIPDFRAVAHTLHSKNFSLIGVFAPNRRNEVDRKRGFPYIDTAAIWTRHFKELGVPFRIDTMASPDVPATVISNLLSTAVIRLTCDVAPIMGVEQVEVQKVQIVFLFDRTQEWSVFLQQFAKKAKTIVYTLKEKFKNKEIHWGIAAFADFALHSKKGGARQHDTLGQDIDPSVRCYEKILALTVDENEFLQELKDLSRQKYVNGFDPPESSMTALLYAASDSSMNWDQGEGTNKVLVLVTNEDTIGSRDAPVLAKKPKPEGNGFDTCTQHSYPDLRTVSTVLKRERITLVGLIARNFDRQVGWDRINSVMLWTTYFTRLGVRYNIQKLQNTAGLDRIDDKAICGVQAVVTKNEWDSEFCFDDEEEPEIIKPEITKLQMAFVFERNSGFQSFYNRFLRNSENFLDRMRRMMTNTQTYSISEFGFSSFDDFDQAIKQGMPSANPLARISCYELNSPLSSSESNFRQKIEEFIAVQWKKVAPDPPQSSLTALLYTATDPKMKWDMGEHVKKVLVLVTNAISVSAVDAPGLVRKPRPNGDGRDTCTDHSFPDAHLVGTHLQLKGFSVLGLIGPNHRNVLSAVNPQSSIWSSWEYAFSRMGVEHIMAPIPIENLDAGMLLAASVEAGSFESGGGSGGLGSMFEDVAFSNMKAMVGGSSSVSTNVLVGDFGGGIARDCLPVTKLQVIFVVDRSSDWTLFTKTFAMMSNDILAGIKLVFKNVEFGITAFSDFHPTLKGGIAKLVNFDPKTSCYERILPLTTDIALVSDKFGDLSRLPALDGGDAPQSSMTALLYTAADKELQWSKSSKDFGVRKVMVLFTNEDTVSGKDAPKLAKKKKPKGDGHDTCTKHSFPNIETTGEILQEKGVNIIAVIPPTKLTGVVDAVSIWNEHLQSLGVGYHIQPLESHTVPGGITRQLIKALKEVSCEQNAPPEEGGGGETDGQGDEEIIDSETGDWVNGATQMTVMQEEIMIDEDGNVVDGRAQEGEGAEDGEGDGQEGLEEE
ncbi:unnamed protein product [Orchesella dallaii]|uniref:VWFA domain-containing protein n=1 Tax=Orchesella dallaii TaxID=48710 RepID=A0ABP1QW17_9HEXA